ncbi:hypothetical protein ACHAPQ_005230 [Fusarium lateritium]
MSSSLEDERDLSSEVDFAPRPTIQSSLQENSPFFTKLNYDIRLQIYRELFGSTRVHLVALNNKMQCLIPLRWTHAICEDPEFCEPWGPCYPYAYEGGSPYRLEVNRLHINFLRACSRAFKEGISVLYRSNTFVFGEPIDYINFLKIFHTRITSAHFGDMSLARGELVPELDLITRILNAWTQLTKVKLSVYIDYMHSSIDESALRFMILKTLKRLLSLQSSRVTIKVPFMSEELRELVEKSGSHSSPEFDPRPSDDGSLFESTGASQAGSENNSEGDSDDGSQSEEA